MRYFLSILTALMVILGLTQTAQADGGFRDSGAAPNAGIQGFKLKLGYPSEATYQTARTKSYATSGKRDVGKLTTDVFFDSTTGSWKRWNGVAWVVVAGGAGGVSLDAAYTSGQSIVRDLNPLVITDGTDDATHTFQIARTKGTGSVVRLVNDSTGLDIEGENWSMSQVGALTANTLVAPTSLKVVPSGASGSLQLGFDGVLEKDLDVVFHGSPLTSELKWDFGLGQLIFAATTAAYFADNALVAFGAGATVPLFNLVYNGSKLVLKTGEEANGTFQIGSDTDTQRIVVEFGNVATSGIEIDPNAGVASELVEYKGTLPVDMVFLPAGEFSVNEFDAITSTPAQRPATGATLSGWAMGDANGDESVMTYWQPPRWTDEAQAINARIVFSTALTACTMGLELCHFPVRIGSTTNHDATLECVEADTVVGATSKQILATADLPIPALAVVNSSRRPLALLVRRDSDDEQDTCKGAEVQILGVELDVVRRFVD